MRRLLFVFLSLFPLSAAAQTTACADLERQGIYALAEGRDYDFLQMAFLGCDWVFSHPGYYDKDNPLHATLMALGREMNFYDRAIRDILDKKITLTNAGAYLIAQETGTFPLFQWAYLNKTRGDLN